MQAFSAPGLWIAQVDCCGVLLRVAACKDCYEHSKPGCRAARSVSESGETQGLYACADTRRGDSEATWFMKQTFAVAENGA
jgi:hypothetical protein